jgi:transcriptional regulator with XRE-family HTH domain
MTPDEARAGFARRVRAERVRRRWSIREASLKSGVSTMTVNRAERGDDLRMGSVLAIAGALEMTMADLFEGPDCKYCGDAPPARFPCPECGRGDTG